MLFYAGTFLKCKKSQGSYTLVFINSIGLGFLEATDTVMYVYDAVSYTHLTLPTILRV